MEINKNITKSSKQISDKKQDIKYDTRDYVVDYLVQQFTGDNFYIPSEYQRRFVWSEQDKCFFIESLLMGLPIPFMFFADTDDGRIEIVDGAQRTQTLVQFVENELKLEGLEILTDSNGFKFEDLELAIQNRFLQTNIRVVFLQEGTTIKTRQEIFKRVNSSGLDANPAEIRRGSHAGVFSAFVEECTKNDLFNSLAPRTVLTEERYEGIELVSRFFAYLNNYSHEYSNYSGNVTEYIDKYVQLENGKCEKNGKQIISKHTKDFESMLRFAEELLGKQGFRKSATSKSTPRARFEALSIGIALALREKPELKVVNADWIYEEDGEFAIKTKSDAANNKKRLIGRITYVKDKLLAGN